MNVVYLSQVSAMGFSSLPYDLIVMALDSVELDSTALKSIAKGLPYGAGWRESLEFRAETQHLLEERDSHYIKKLMSGMTLNFVPVAHRTGSVCSVALQKSITPSFTYVPDEFKTQELCEKAVDACGNNIDSVPDEFKTQELCERAIAYSPYGLRYIPDAILDRKMCIGAINRFDWALKFIPVEKRAAELCWLAVAKNGLELKYVPEDLKTWKMCQLAVRKGKGEALRFIPFQFLTKSLCWLAVCRNLSGWEFALRLLRLFLGPHTAPLQWWRWAFLDEFESRLEKLEQIR